MSFRFDRFATLYLVKPIRRDAPGNEPAIPILMYHSIADQDEPGVQAYYRTITTPSTFALHMKHLADQGYSAIHLAQAVKFLQNGAAPKKSVVITFDDGYSDFHRHAFPVLNQFGFAAMVFLPTAYIADYPLQFKGKDCLTWPEVRELQRHGVAFGSHTVTHPQLLELNAQAIQEEIANSKYTIEEKLGCAVESFAYPFAFPQTEADFIRMLRNSLRQAGYQNGVCTVVGRASCDSDPFFMQRLPVNSCDDPRFFMTKLSGAYDWVAVPQHLLKLAKTSVNTQQRQRHHSSHQSVPPSLSNLTVSHNTITMTPQTVGTYALITPAKNEANYIERTIASVLSQTLKPVKWVIVDDGSTDNTAAIIERYSSVHDFIRLVRISGARNRLFSNKAVAFNAGLQQLASENYSYIGNLDADITLPSAYYEHIIDEFGHNSRLGIAGGVVYTTVHDRFVTGDTAPDSVGGAIQLFRRDCFEQIGGYLPLRRGGIDTAAEIMARMRGWIVRKYPENKVYENRRTGSVGGGILAACFNAGIRFHSLGYSTIFYLARSIYKVTESPVLIGSLVALIGFLSVRLMQHPVSLPSDVVSYLRAEQMAKLKRMLFGRLDPALPVHQ